MQSLKHIALLSWILWLVTVSTGLVAAPACEAMQELSCPCCEHSSTEQQEMTCLMSLERPTVAALSNRVVVSQPDAAPIRKGLSLLALIHPYLLAQSNQASQRSLSYLPPSTVRNITLLLEVFRI